MAYITQHAREPLRHDGARSTWRPLSSTRSRSIAELQRAPLQRPQIRYALFPFFLGININYFHSLSLFTYNLRVLHGFNFINERVV